MEEFTDSEGGEGENYYQHQYQQKTQHFMGDSSIFLGMSGDDSKEMGAGSNKYSRKMNPTDWVYCPTDTKALDDNTSNSDLEDAYMLDDDDHHHGAGKGGAHGRQDNGAKRPPRHD